MEDNENVDFRHIGGAGIRFAKGRAIIGQAPKIVMHADREDANEHAIGPRRPILDLQPTLMPLHKLLEVLLPQASSGGVTDILGHVRITSTESHAWAAGFFDGEGCVLAIRTVEHDHAHYRLRLAIPQVRQTPLLILHAMYGGTVRPRTPQGNRQECWTWNVTGSNALRALRSMRPYLVRKAEVADLGLTFAARFDRGMRLTTEEEAIRMDLIAQIRQHNRRGKIAFLPDERVIITDKGIVTLDALDADEGKVEVI